MSPSLIRLTAFTEHLFKLIFALFIPLQPRQVAKWAPAYRNTIIVSHHLPLALPLVIASSYSPIVMTAAETLV